MSTNTWTMRDIFRLSHPKGVNPAIGEFVLHGAVTEDAPEIIKGFEAVQAAKSAKGVIKVLEVHKNLPWEAVPTDYLKSVDVWKKIFYNGQLNGQALIRNVTRLAKLGAFADLGFAADYAKALTDESMIAKTRLHPINYLNALVVYTEGQVGREVGWGFDVSRRKDWVTEPVIADALNDGFYLAFKHVEPANKRTMIATDISGSMGQKALGLDLSCAQVSAAVAMTVARTEPAYTIKGFSTGLVDLNISARTRLDTAMREVSNRNFGGTDISAPMVWAQKNKVEIDTFCVITDNETWAGRIQPFQALKAYRKATGIDARLAVLGVASTGFTIADPTDRGMIDFVGMDANVPRVLSDFSAGRI